MIESPADLAFAPVHEAQECTSAIRFTDGRILQCKGFKEIVDETDKRTLYFPDICLGIPFTSYSILIYNKQGQLVIEKAYDSGPQLVGPKDTLKPYYAITWRGNQKAKEASCSLSPSLMLGPVNLPLTPCVWESILTPS